MRLVGSAPAPHRRGPGAPEPGPTRYHGAARLWLARRPGRQLGAGPLDDLKKRTLTALYNARPPWLAQAHARLDAAVRAAYGWPADLPDAAILERLLALNAARAGRGEPAARTAW